MQKILKKPGIFLFVLLIAGAIQAFAQAEEEDGPVAERIKSAKIGLITTRLNLTADQSKQFWPVYEAYETDRKKIRVQMRRLRVNSATVTATDDEIRKDLKELLNLRQKEVDAEKEYVGRFLKVVSPRQMVELYKSEKEFNRMLLQELRERRTGKKGGR